MFDLPWDFSVIPQYFFDFRFAASLTLQLTTLGIVMGLFIGLVIGLMSISQKGFINGIAKAYVWFIRGTPLLLQIWVFYYGMAEVINIPRFPAAAMGLAIHNGAYVAEIFRGAIQSINRGQREAALSLGMTPVQAMVRIILPQAFKRSIPPLGNQFIIALKDSSLASTVAVRELMLRARQIGASTYMQMEMLIIVAVYYLIMTSVLTVIVNKVEKRLKISDYVA